MEIQWSLLLFSLIAGTGGSLLAFTGLAEALGHAPKARKQLLIVVLVLVVVGGLCSVMHLEQKANIMAAAANVFSFSPISMELIMVGFAFVIGVVYLVCAVKEVGAGALRVVGVLGIIAGVLLGYVTGSGYQMGSQPNWNTVLLPLAYLGTDLACGGALFLAICAASKAEGEPAKPLPTVAFGAGVLSVVLFLAYGLTSGFAAEPAMFGIGAVCAVAAAGVLATCLKGAKLAPAAGACVLALVAGVCLRAFMWLIGTGTLDLFTAAAEHLVL